ncbi:MAG: PqqD family protein [Gemmatimonadota bacterium]
MRATELDDDIVLLDLRAGEYFSLNASGALIWKVITEGGDLGAVLAASEAWPLPAAERHSVVLALIRDLLSRGLLMRQAPAGPA